jgi:hypothetical protein
VGNKGRRGVTSSRCAGRGLVSLLALLIAVLLLRVGMGGVWATPIQRPLQQTSPPPESIVGTVFEDLDRNARQDWVAGEMGIPGVWLSLSSDVTATRVVSTNQIGDYQFADLTGGATYTITQTDLVGYFSTTPNVVTRTVEEPPASGLIVNFGDHRLYSVFLPVILRHGAL